MLKPSSRISRVRLEIELDDELIRAEMRSMEASEFGGDEDIAFSRGYEKAIVTIQRIVEESEFLRRGCK